MTIDLAHALQLLRDLDLQSGTLAIIFVVVITALRQTVLWIARWRAAGPYFLTYTIARSPTNVKGLTLLGVALLVDVALLKLHYSNTIQLSPGYGMIIMAAQAIALTLVVPISQVSLRLDVRDRALYYAQQSCHRVVHANQTQMAALGGAAHSVHTIADRIANFGAEALIRHDRELRRGLIRQTHWRYRIAAFVVGAGALLLTVFLAGLAALPVLDTFRTKP